MSKMIIAAGPVIVEHGKVLLNKHGEDNFWKFCGGRVEDDECNAKNAAVREVKEEMGIDVEFLSDEPFFVYAEKEKEGKNVSVILVHFMAKRIGEVSPGSDIREWRWIPIEELQNEELAPNIMPVLRHFKFID